MALSASRTSLLDTCLLDDGASWVAFRDQQLSRVISGKAVEQSSSKVSRFMTRITNFAYLKIGLWRLSKTEWAGTKLLLSVLKESSDVFPPLKSAVGGLVALVDVYERAKSNRSEMQDIARRVDRLMGILAGRLGGDRETVLRFTDEPFVETLTVQLGRLKVMRSRGKLSHVMQSARLQGELKEICKTIERAVQELQLCIGLSLERLTRAILQETVLQSLTRAKAAAYTAAVSPNGMPRRHCTPGTRDLIISQILAWAHDEREETAPVYWICGLAGQGKTTIAYTICERLEERTRDASLVSFFCSRQLDTHDERVLASTLALGLADRSASYASMLVDALKAEHHLGDQKLDIQMSKLFVGPWERSSYLREGLHPIIMVIDALDENAAGAEFIERILLASRSGRLTGLRILITSRPEPAIKHLCEDIDGRAVCNLNDVSRDVVGDDILHFLHEELPEHRNKSYLIELARISDGLFIYASTAVRLVKSKGRYKTRSEQEFTIRQIINRAATRTTSSGILDDLYTEILEDALERLDARERATRERVLLIVVCTSVSLRVPFLQKMAGVEDELVQLLIDALYPVLYVDAAGNVLWHHASFQDFVLATYKSSVMSTWLWVIRWCWDVLARRTRETFTLPAPLLTSDDLTEIFGVPDCDDIRESAVTQKLVDHIIDLVLNPKSRRVELRLLDSKRVEAARRAKEQRRAWQMEEGMRRTEKKKQAEKAERKAFVRRVKEKGQEATQEEKEAAVRAIWLGLEREEEEARRARRVARMAGRARTAREEDEEE